VDLAEAVAVDVGVDLCGGDVCVSQEVLDDAEVGAAGEQVGGECVAQEVGVDVLEPRGVGVLADDLPDRDAFEWSACAREEHRARGTF